MAVVTSATPDWMAALRNKNRDKKKDDLSTSPKTESQSTPTSKPVWLAKLTESKTNSGGRNSPAARRTAVGDHRVERSASPNLARLGLKTPATETSAQSATLPRSFGGSSTVSASTSITSSQTGSKRSNDDSSLGSATKTSGAPAGKASSSKNTKPSVSHLRSLFNKSTGKEESPASPKLEVSRPRFAATVTTKPGEPNSVETATKPSQQPNTSVGITPTKSSGLEVPAAGEKLRRISEDRQTLSFAAGKAAPPAKSDAPSSPSSQTSQTGTRRRVDSVLVHRNRAQSDSSLQSTQHTAKTSLAEDKEDEACLAEALECTNIDDIEVDPDMVRAFSLDSTALRRNLGHSATASAPVSPTTRKRRNSILMTPERKMSQSKLKRRVSFSELKLETVHQFQREEPVVSDSDSDEDVHRMVKRNLVSTEVDGISTELHPMLSPQSRAWPKSSSSRSAPSVGEDYVDAPPDLYTDVPNEVAELLM